MWSGQGATADWSQFYGRLADGWNPALAKAAQEADRLFERPVTLTDVRYWHWKIGQHLDSLSTGVTPLPTGQLRAGEEAGHILRARHVLERAIDAYRIAETEGKNCVVSRRLAKALNQQRDELTTELGASPAEAVFRAGLHLGRPISPEIVQGEVVWLRNEASLTYADRELVDAQVKAAQQDASFHTPRVVVGHTAPTPSVWTNSIAAVQRFFLHITGPNGDDTPVSVRSTERVDPLSHQSTLQLIDARLESLQQRANALALADEAFQTGPEQQRETVSSPNLFVTPTFPVRSSGNTD